MPHIELPFEYQYSPLHFTNYHHPLCFRSVHRLHLRPLTSYPTVSYPWTPCPVLHSPQVCTYLTVCSLIMMNIKECVYIIISLQGVCVYHNLFARSVYLIIIFARSVILAFLCKNIATHSLRNVFNYSVLHAINTLVLSTSLWCCLYELLCAAKCGEWKTYHCHYVCCDNARCVLLIPFMTPISLL